MRFSTWVRSASSVAVLSMMVSLGTSCLLGQERGPGSTIVAHLRGAAQSAEAVPAPAYSLLHSFQCGPDGGYPEAGMAMDTVGNLYGTTNFFGASGYGTVFRLAADGSETVLYSFAGPPDGENPGTILTLDPAGNIYGTTTDGGKFGFGVIFEVTAAGGETVLYNFTGGQDGAFPQGGMVRDTAGNLFGTTAGGGIYGSGVVFKLNATGRERVLLSFGSVPEDGRSPAGALVRDPKGNLYGTTAQGGASNQGTVFRFNTSGTETLLHSFAGFPTDGAMPVSYGGGLLRDAAGNLFGVTYDGGRNGNGVVFRVTPAGLERVVVSFNGGEGGGNPFDGLAEDAAGNLYGTTSVGGSVPCESEGCGVLFMVSPKGKEVILHNFDLSSADGAFPIGGVVRDPAGNLYGTLELGGAAGCGAVFKYTLASP